MRTLRRPAAVPWLVVAVLAVVAVFTLVPSDPAVDGPTGGAPTAGVTASPQSPPPATRVPPSATAALAALDTLEVKGRAPRTGYSREAFGQAWADTDRNGCDTRNDVLRRDLRDVTLDERTRGCVVLAGTLDDPYSARPVAFVRGERSDEVQIDHVVALSDAWQKGAGAWSDAARETFANDPLNLLAVDGSLNAQKGAGDAATWLPPSRPYRCSYAARQVAVKVRYGLWVTAAEGDALRRILDNCPDAALPTSPPGAASTAAPLTTAPPTTAPPTTAPPTTAPPTTAPPTAVPPTAAQPDPPVAAPADTLPTDGTDGTLDPRSDSCSALPPGYGPYVSGVDPEYAWYRDGDSDGTVCE